jgi:D-3-phosphoglycerate dehydrogenase / 2-oxoglutarate reductase
LKGALSGHTEEQVNDVNASAIARERGIAVAETNQSHARDFTDLVRVSVVSGEDNTRVVGTVFGRRHRPHLLEAWGSRFNVQLEDHLAVFRYRDQPGMIGRVGTVFGEQGINIVSAAVGRHPDDELSEDGEATMVITTDAQVPQAVIDQIVASGGFMAGRAVSL